MHIQVRRWLFLFCVLLSVFTSFFNVGKVLAIGDQESSQAQVKSEVIDITLTQFVVKLFGGYFVFKTLYHLATKIIDNVLARHIG
ncbi:MAG: hypothetical protein LBM02_10365 [Lachnospiraceae bacterium]|jgi:hypothetical protein|nr:hypothetical protein [Lachnospiraceae bacterium]